MRICAESYKCFEEEKRSLSYPGLLSRYVTHAVSVPPAGNSAFVIVLALRRVDITMTNNMDVICKGRSGTPTKSFKREAGPSVTEERASRVSQERSPPAGGARYGGPGAGPAGLLGL